MKKGALGNKTGAATMPPIKPSGKWRLWLIMGAIALFTFCTFSPALNDGFINQDDDIFVYNNPSLSKPIGEAIPYFFGPHYFQGNYIPLTMVGYSLIWHAAGNEPALYHKVNICLHILAVLLVFWLTYLLSGKKWWVAGFVALFFGIHPMHVESVVWVSELKDMLYTCFFVGGLIAYYKYIQDTAPGKRGSIYLLLASFVCFAIAVLAKPAAVVFPVVLMLFDWYLHRKPDLRMWVEKAPFFIVSVIFGIITINAQRAAQLINNHYPLAQRLVLASYALLMYVFKLLVPIHLSVYYPYPQLVDGHLPYGYYLCPLLVIGMLYGVYRSRRYGRLVAFGCLFFLINIFLMLQIVSDGNSIMADHYTYVSYIGLLYIIAMGIHRIYERKQLTPYMLAAPVVVLAVICCGISYARCAVWENDDTMATDMVTKYPDDHFALNNKGYLLFAQGRYDEALPYLSRAVQLAPDFVKADINLANTYLAMKEIDKADSVTDLALKYTPHNEYLLVKKGLLLSVHRRYPEAIKMLQEALKVNRENMDAYVQLGHCYYEQRDYSNWERTVDAGLAVDHNNFMLLNNKGYALFLQHRYAEAIPYYKAALNIQPDFTTASVNLADCYKAMGK